MCDVRSDSSEWGRSCTYFQNTCSIHIHTYIDKEKNNPVDIKIADVKDLINKTIPIVKKQILTLNIFKNSGDIVTEFIEMKDYSV